MKKFTFLFVSFIVLFSSVVFLTFTISAHLSAYHGKKMEMAQTLNFEERLMNVWEWVPFNTVGEEKVVNWQKLEQESEAIYEKTLWMGTALAGIVLLFTFANLLYYRKRPHKLQIYGLVMVFSALSFLYLGLQSPFLELEAYNKDLAFKIPVDIDLDAIPAIDIIKYATSSSDVRFGHFKYDLEQTFEGRIYYFYQNKSILELIKLLYTGGNFLVAICLLLASIIFPITKLLTSMIVFLNPHTRFARKAVPVINNLGKWSMADVFVASIFLAYFSFVNMNVGVDTGATTLIGTYFFLTFVVLSILSGSVFKNLTSPNLKKLDKIALESFRILTSKADENNLTVSANQLTPRFNSYGTNHKHPAFLTPVDFVVYDVFTPDEKRVGYYKAYFRNGLFVDDVLNWE